MKAMTNAEYLRMLRQRAIAEGRCSMCRARPVRTGRKLCQLCCKKNDVKNRARYAALLASGRCPRCGAAPVDGRKLCAACLERSRVAQRRA